MERESERLDESFQAYLRRQKSLKQQMNADVTQIWENYNLSKAALEQYDSVVGQANLTSNVSKFLNTTIIDGTANDKMSEYDDILKDLEEIKQLASPQFDKDDLFPTEIIFPKNDRTSKDLDTTPVEMSTKNLPNELSDFNGKVKKAESLFRKIFETSTPKKNETKQIDEVKMKTAKSNKKTLNGIDDYLNQSKHDLITSEHSIIESDKVPANETPTNEPIQQKEFKTSTLQNDVVGDKKSTVNTLNKISTNADAPENVTDTAKNVEKIMDNTPIASTSKQFTNGQKTVPTFAKLSSIESGDDTTSERISIGPSQTIKDDDFWI